MVENTRSCTKAAFPAACLLFSSRSSLLKDGSKLQGGESKKKVAQTFRGQALGNIENCFKTDSLIQVSIDNGLYPRACTST